MKSFHTSRRNGPTIVLIGALGVMGAIGVVGTLWALGQIDLPFLTRRVQAPSHEGMVPVPVSSKAIPAYTQITREYLLDPTTSVVQVIYLDPKEVQLNTSIVTTVDKILGRVMDHDKPAGYLFTENDFLPPGTRPGLVAGIPSGKRAVDLQADKIAGIQALKTGDHFDLLCSLPVDDKKAGPGAAVVALGVRSPLSRQGWVNVLVQDGVVVMPVTTREVPVGTVTRAGVPAQTKPVQEVVIAVDPKEMAPLTEALDFNQHVTCVVRSGRPDDPGPSSTTPGSAPPKRQVIEVINGKSREFVEFPLAPEHPAGDGSPGTGPSVSAEGDRTDPTVTARR